jgi:hypothetical protein
MNTMPIRTPSTLSRWALFALMALPAGALSAGCDLAAPSAPTTSTPTRTTETFDGSFASQGSVAHPFTIVETGVVDIRLVTVSPLSTMALGLAVGAWNGSACTASNVRNDSARSGSVALSGTSATGDFCVLVYDSGNVPATVTVTYQVQVTHP